MRTKAKLTVAALGFVATTTGLVFWQSTPPRLETAARRLAFTRSYPHEEIGREEIIWLSSDKVIVGSVNATELLDLKHATKHSLPFLNQVRAPDGFHYIDSSSLTLSPDGKWVLALELVEQKHQPTQQSWLVFHSDGTSLHRIPVSKNTTLTGKPLWFSDSRGWLSYWERENGDKGEYGRTFYALDRKISPREELVSRQSPSRASVAEAIQADGRLLCRPVNDLKVFSLCNLDRPDHCEPLVFALPPGREKADVQQLVVSHDSQSALASLWVQAPPIQERLVWEELLKRKFTVAYNELWWLSRNGEKSRCLVRESLTAEYDTAFSIELFSPDGKHAIVQNSAGKYYLLSL